MARRQFVPPPVWDDVRLEAWRREAVERFITERSAEGSTHYRTVFATNVRLVEELFAATNDLLDLGSGAALAAHPTLLTPARYLGRPPISADDLDTLADTRIASRQRLDADLGQKAAHVIQEALDPEHFPWLLETPPRPPTPTERDTAIRWTAGLRTVQEIQTVRRSESAARQEQAVERLLLEVNFRKVAPRPIEVTDGKANAWGRAFGDKAIIAAVLASSIRLKCQTCAGAGC